MDIDASVAYEADEPLIVEKVQLHGLHFGEVLIKRQGQVTLS